MVQNAAFCKPYEVSHLAEGWVLSGALALATPPEGAQAPSTLFNLLPIALIFLVFYFVLFAPMRRREKKHREMLAAVKPGDKVITSGGIHGTVTGIDGDIVQVRIADQVKIQVERNAIADRRSEG